MRAIDSVTWKVGVNARFTRPQSLSDPTYDVLGAIGESSYVLPETQNPDIVWPGVSTEGIDYSQFLKGCLLPGRNFRRSGEYHGRLGKPRKVAHSH